MTIQKIDARFRSTLVWRAVGIAACLWVAGVIGFAGFAAYNDGLELYRWTMLGLLLLGLPAAVVAVSYAAILLGQKGRKIVITLIFISCIVIASLKIYSSYQSHVRAEERRVAQLAENAEMAKRTAAREAQYAEDWQNFEENCRKNCENLGDYTEMCPIHCSQRRGDKIRSKKWSEEKASCATQCAAYPDRICDRMCEMDRSDIQK
jgi:Tfp pilus assembly protein PilE